MTSKGVRQKTKLQRLRAVVRTLIYPGCKSDTVVRSQGPAWLTFYVHGTTLKFSTSMCFVNSYLNIYIVPTAATGLIHAKRFFLTVDRVRDILVVGGT